MSKELLTETRTAQTSTLSNSWSLKHVQYRPAPCQTADHADTYSTDQHLVKQLIMQTRTPCETADHADTYTLSNSCHAVNIMILQIASAWPKAIIGFNSLRCPIAIRFVKPNQRWVCACWNCLYANAQQKHIQLYTHLKEREALLSESFWTNGSLLKV